MNGPAGQIAAFGDNILFVLEKIINVLLFPFVFLWKILRRLLKAVLRSCVSLFAPEGADRGEYAASVRFEMKKRLRSPSYAVRMIGEEIRGYRFTVRKALLWIMPVIAAVLLGITVHAINTQCVALKVVSGDKVLGYVASEREIFTARENAQNRLSLGGTGEGAVPEVRYVLAFIDINRFTDVNTLENELLALSDVPLTEAAAVYVDGEYFCTVKKEEDAKNVFDRYLNGIAKDDPSAIVTFAENITYEHGLYPDNGQILSESQLQKKVNVLIDTDSFFSVKTVKTVIRDEIVPREVIEIDSDTLYSGTMRILTEGEDGVDQITGLATYINGVRTATKDVYRQTLKEPSARRLQVGKREQKGMTGVIDPAAAIPVAYLGGKMVWPVAGAYNINSDYGYRWGKLHAGLDIGMGSAPGTSLGKNVVAAADGVVTLASTHSSYGYYIIIDHGGGVQTVYGHLYAGSFMVAPGQAVTQGQPIARVGSTGYSTGPHLHFEVRVNGTKVDPKTFLGL